MDKKLCYKVVSLDDAGFVSYATRGAAEVIYDLGVEATAPDWLAKLGFHIFVFDTLENAVKFSGAESDTAILECNCSGEVELPEISHPLSWLRIGQVNDKYAFKPASWPLGTLMFRSVTPVDIIDNDAALELVRINMYDMEEYCDD